jgi:DNA-binding beta-propeller fold protein YncE
MLLAIMSCTCEPVFGMGLDFVIPDPEPAPIVEPVITPGPLGAPVRLDSYSDTILIVSDYSSGTIFNVNKTDPSEVSIRFSIEGRALAVGHLGKNIIVGNASTGTLEVYDKNGKFKYILNNDEKIVRPSDLAVDQHTKQIFVVDSRERQIKVFDKKNLLFSFGESELVNPVGIALDPLAELVYVSDHGDSGNDVLAAVYKFTYDGVKLGKLDSEAFGFYRPRGLAFDLGKLYITDALAGEVTVIDLDSMTKLGVLGEYGSDPGQLVQPQDVTIDQGGAEVYVANKRLGRIEIISIGGMLQ